MITAAVPRVWSTAFFTAVVRYVVVGVGTGALVGLVLAVLSSAFGDVGLEGLSVLTFFSALIGAALSLLPAAVGAATGLVVAVRRPGDRWLVLSGLLWCPALLVAWFAWLWMSLGLHGWPQQLTALLAVEVVVITSVAMTQRWVTSPLTGAEGGHP